MPVTSDRLRRDLLTDPTLAKEKKFRSTEVEMIDHIPIQGETTLGRKYESLPSVDNHFFFGTFNFLFENSALGRRPEICTESRPQTEVGLPSRCGVRVAAPSGRIWDASGHHKLACRRREHLGDATVLEGIEPLLRYLDEK